MTALEKYLLEGLHKVTQNNELCIIVHMNTCLRWALMQGESEVDAWIYALMEGERLLSQATDSIMDQQENIGKTTFKIGEVYAKGHITI